MEKLSVAFIGLGVMGAPMAARIIAQGHKVFLNTRRDTAEYLIQKGGIDCANPAEAAKNAEFIFTMVQDTPDVEKVIFGENGIAETISPNSVLIDMSSISPKSTAEFAEKIRSAGSEYLDAPVSGGDIGAINGTLTIMVGGNQQAFDRALPLLNLMGKSINLIGDVGAGQICKLANQIVGAQAIQAVAEALLFAAKAGVDPAKVREALLGGFAGSRVLEVHGLRMIERDFKPGFTTSLHQKDMQNVLKFASEMGITLPNASTTAAYMNAAIGMGCGSADSSSLLKVLETMNGIKVNND